MRTLLLLVVVTVMATTARADEDPRALYDQGVVAYGLGKYDKAADLYERAFTLKPDPALLFNAAQAHRLAGNKKRALMLYQNFLRLFPNRTNRADVIRLIDDLKHAIAQDEKTATSPPTETMHAQLPPNTPERKPPPAAVVGATSNSVSAAAPDRRPIYKKGWFWGAVVGGAVVVGLAVGLGVGLGVKSDPVATWGSVKGF